MFFEQQGGSTVSEEGLKPKPHICDKELWEAQAVIGCSAICHSPASRVYKGC
jgi:hypothetical protein